MGTNLKRAAVLAVGALLALSACGGDDSDEVSSGGAVESLPSDATDSGAAATDAPSGTDATGNTAGDIELDGDFCSATAQMMERFDDMETSTSEDPIAGLSEAFATLGEMAGSLDELKETAPDELKDDVTTLSDAFASFQENLPELQQLSEDMEAAGSDPAKLQDVMTKYQDLMTTLDMSALDSAEVQEAGDNISTYVSDVCGLDIGS